MNHTTDEISNQLELDNNVPTWLTNTIIATPLMIWMPVIILDSYLSIADLSDDILFRKFLPALPLSVFELMVFILYGMACWSLSEYLLHRFVFHYKAKTRLGRSIIQVVHGTHHDNPADQTRVITNPVISLVAGAVFFAAFFIYCGKNVAFAAYSGFIAGYLVYDYTHYFIHHHQPKSEYGNKLKDHHMMHHFADPHSKWGVTSWLWDFLFRTLQTK